MRFSILNVNANVYSSIWPRICKCSNAADFKIHCICAQVLLKYTNQSNSCLSHFKIKRLPPHHTHTPNRIAPQSFSFNLDNGFRIKKFISNRNSTTQTYIHIYKYKYIYSLLTCKLYTAVAFSVYKIQFNCENVFNFGFSIFTSIFYKASLFICVHHHILLYVVLLIYTHTYVNAQRWYIFSFSFGKKKYFQHSRYTAHVVSFSTLSSVYICAIAYIYWKNKKKYSTQ